MAYEKELFRSEAYFILIRPRSRSTYDLPKLHVVYVLLICFVFAAFHVDLYMYSRLLIISCM